MNGRGGPSSPVTQATTTHVENGVSHGVSSIPPHNNSNRGGMFPRGGSRSFRGRGFSSGVDRGRGVVRGGFRGRGRASFAAPVAD